VQAGKLAAVKPLASWVVLVFVAAAAFFAGSRTASADDLF
jgi:hypothetical protein